MCDKGRGNWETLMPLAEWSNKGRMTQRRILPIWLQSVVPRTLQIPPWEQEYIFIFLSEERQRRRELQRNHWLYQAHFSNLYLLGFFFFHFSNDIILRQDWTKNKWVLISMQMLGHCWQNSWPIRAPVFVLIKWGYNIHWILSTFPALMVPSCYF